MKATEVIDRLVELVEEHGDFDVCTLDAEAWSMLVIESIQLTHITPGGGWQDDMAPNAFYMSLDEDAE